MNRQAQYFNLIRSGLLDHYEVAVLSYVTSYSSYCYKKRLQIIADELHMSERKLRYTINSLVAKGILRKSYTYYKRVILVIASLAEQAKILGQTVVTAAHKIKKYQWLRSDRHECQYPYRHGATEPIKNKTLENKKDAFPKVETEEIIMTDSVGSEFLAKIKEKLGLKQEIFSN